MPPFNGMQQTPQLQGMLGNQDEEEGFLSKAGKFFTSPQGRAILAGMGSSNAPDVLGVLGAGAQSMLQSMPQPQDPLKAAKTQQIYFEMMQKQQEAQQRQQAAEEFKKRYQGTAPSPQSFGMPQEASLPQQGSPSEQMLPQSEGIIPGTGLYRDQLEDVIQTADRDLVAATKLKNDFIEQNKKYHNEMRKEQEQRIKDQEQRILENPVYKAQQEQIAKGANALIEGFANDAEAQFETAAKGNEVLAIMDTPGFDPRSGPGAQYVESGVRFFTNMFDLENSGSQEAFMKALEQLVPAAITELRRRGVTRITQGEILNLLPLITASFKNTPEGIRKILGLNSAVLPAYEAANSRSMAAQNKWNEEFLRTGKSPFDLRQKLGKIKKIREDHKLKLIKNYLSQGQ
jgi:hypothetical protein